MHFINELAVGDQPFLFLQYNEADELLIYDPLNRPQTPAGLCTLPPCSHSSWQLITLKLSLCSVLLFVHRVMTSRCVFTWFFLLRIKLLIMLPFGARSYVWCNPAVYALFFPPAVTSPSLTLWMKISVSVVRMSTCILLFVMLQAHDDLHNMFSLHEPGEEYIVQYLNAVTALKLLVCTF